MSIEALKWAFEQEDVAPGPRFVLVALANRADEEGIAFPSIKWIKKKTGLPERNIRMYIDGLCEIGKLMKTERRRDDGGRSSNEYRLAILQPGLALTPPAATAGGGAATAGAPRQQLPHPPAATAGHKTKEKTKETKQHIGTLVPDLPNWLPIPEWEAFVADRKERRKALTSRATEMAITTLAELREMGQDLAAVLNQSIANGWSGLFAVKVSTKAPTSAGLADRNKAAAAEFTRSMTERPE